MKKILSVILAVAMLAAVLAGCGAKDKTPAENPSENVPASALEILENVWGAYAEEEKFPVSGGDPAENPMGAPGAYDMENADSLTYTLLVPAEELANITDAASMMHMMNTNIFAGGAFRLAEGVTVSDFAAVMRESILGNQWMCGFPEKMMIAGIGGEYVIVSYGHADPMDSFAAHLAQCYPDAETLYSENIL